MQIGAAGMCARSVLTAHRMSFPILCAVCWPVFWAEMKANMRESINGNRSVRFDTPIWHCSSRWKFAIEKRWPRACFIWLVFHYMSYGFPSSSTLPPPLLSRSTISMKGKWMKLQVTTSETRPSFSIQAHHSFLAVCANFTSGKHCETSNGALNSFYLNKFIALVGVVLCTDSVLAIFDVRREFSMLSFFFVFVSVFVFIFLRGTLFVDVTRNS